MKIAIAADGNNISGHFGHCQGFMIYEIENGEILNHKFEPNPGHKPGFLPVFLSERGVNTIISGGMGASAQQLFSNNNIEVIVGASGDCNQIVVEYLKGELESTGTICEDHAHEGHCED
ncbi:MAG: dinitrogenase iron-molybdenum cofactor [Tissierellia bacterium]|nr:dinitrogenase iron-molybdenum cofactor [Tissierellia bacterium]